MTSPKVTRLTLGWKFYLHSVLLAILVDLICHMTMYENLFWPPGHPQRPKVPPLGHDPGNRMRILSDMFCIFLLWEHIQSLEYKSLNLTFVIEIKWFLTPPQVWAPQSPTPGAWPRQQNENPFWYVLYLSFVRTHTKFGIKIFEIGFEIKWYMTFDLTQGHKIDPRMKILLAFCSARHPRGFDMPHDMPIYFDHLGTLSAPKSHPWGMTQATEWESFLICFVSFFCENTYKVWNINLWIWLL